ncbi:enoyl reductase [Sinosporangium album]|uniref:Enoyl reductase n=1 Tax=Sinosporangium album TaxID=504805 RepID=A0A1G7W4T6_9ACTN|nr:hypothetical protein [Sinosporangium album]SDG66749.1 enoyl reductase [Sinosporangium album]
MTRLLSLLVGGSLLVSGMGGGMGGGMAGMAAPAAAQASTNPGDGGGPSGETWQKGDQAGVNLRNSTIVVNGGGGGGKSTGYRLKSPCWYEPARSAQEMLDAQQGVRDQWMRFTPGADSKKHDKFLKQFKDKVGERGRWWAPAYNANDPNGNACWSGLQPFLWVPEGETPPAGITLAELTDIARAALTVPKPAIRINPDAESYVNLDTFVWLDGTGTTTRSSTASLAGMTATVTATLSRIAIKSGTSGARATVANNCGRTGQRYTRGAALRCGVRYKRASLDQPRDVYTMTVTATWTITANGVAGTYAPVSMSATRDIPVGEVQTTVRSRS